jgi:PPOX class probable F420-dependent enzyme
LFRSVDASARVESARVARLATLGADGRPHLVPICFVLAGDVLYSAVDEKPKRTKQLKRLKNIRRNPKVSVLVDHYDEDWSRLWWVRLDGDARVLEEGPEREDAVALLLEKYEQYRIQPPTGAVIAIAIERSRAWAPEPGSIDEGGAS